jgi:phosphoribosylcarboxyaminoimidazole (NCAIR) mutase
LRILVVAALAGLADFAERGLQVVEVVASSTAATSLADFVLHLLGAGIEVAAVGPDLAGAAVPFPVLGVPSTKPANGSLDSVATSLGVGGRRWRRRRARGR